METPTAELKAKIEADLDKQWGTGEDAWGGQDGYKKELQGGKTGNLEGGIGLCGTVLTRVEKIMLLDWRRSEMVVNSCLDNLEGRMRYGSDFPRRRKRGTIEWR